MEIGWGRQLGVPMRMGEFVVGETVLYDENGKIQYRGEVSNGQYEGKGSLYADGELIYEGDFHESLYEGSGTLNQGTES